MLIVNNIKKFCIIWLLLFTNIVIADPAQIVLLKDLRIWPSPGNTRLVFDLTGTINYKVFTLNSPERIVIDLENAKLKAKLPHSYASDTEIIKIRSGIRDHHNLRLVIETKQKLLPKVFVQSPMGSYGYRLIIDLSMDKQAVLALFDLEKENKPAETGIGLKEFIHHKIKNSKNAKQANITNASINTEKARIYTIALDPGHGGEDPGAVGPTGSREKDVVLKIAKAFKQVIDQEPNMRAVLIRDGDYYISLRERMQRARKHKADLFISIHADAFEYPQARGSSVYVLSEKGSSSAAAKWLAESENKADLIGGVNIEDKNSSLVSVLLDLSQAANEKESLEAASLVLKNLGKIAPLHKRHVERAGFAVLKAPDVPSFLVETGFISNPKSEKELINPEHHKALAKQMLEGLRKYFHGKHV